MERTLRLGIAGLVNAGHAVLRSLDKVSGVRLAAVAGVREKALEKLRASHPRFALFTSVAEMCARAALDAVWIATPNACHAEHAIAAADHGSPEGKRFFARRFWIAPRSS
ncbi:MAG TPA: Gfo/Idh/MocA family oxidoreductase [Candidatus Acidoferrales bacterium]|nr:Gfo/Idh/MocA family oxidoreductase [Candidatus Acidoferrales bacterium]